jgi:hypothetical protein
MDDVTRIHKGDTGTEFQFTIKDQDGTIVNLSTATVKKVKFKRPDTSILIKDATFVTDGIDGKIKYVTLSTDLNAAGFWVVQGYVEVGSGKWHSNKTSFLVYDVIEQPAT